MVRVGDGDRGRSRLGVKVRCSVRSMVEVRNLVSVGYIDSRAIIVVTRVCHTTIMKMHKKKTGLLLKD